MSPTVLFLSTHWPEGSEIQKKEINEISHVEHGWIDNIANRGLINYQKYELNVKRL